MVKSGGATLEPNHTEVLPVDLPKLLTANFNYCIHCRYKGQCHSAANKNLSFSLQTITPGLHIKSLSKVELKKQASDATKLAFSYFILTQILIVALLSTIM
ncbi:MAG: hypothetical protein WBA41_16745, partial [Rivularia sp. (in: cyanobacteria)]